MASGTGLPPTAGPLRIALLGAECTGKSTLARQLAQAFSAEGRPAIAVPEYLREWVDARGRTPRPDEQAGIAAEQQRRVDAAAAALPAHGILIADTTALQTAVYSEIVFGDRSLYPQALAWQRGYALALLTALDLPWQPDGLQRDGPAVRPPVDALLRSALVAAGGRWSSIHGQGPARLQAARLAIEFAASGRVNLPSSGGHHTQPPAAAAPAADAAHKPGRWRGWCERCGDADCEHQLFGGCAAAGTGDGAAAAQAPPPAVTAAGDWPADGPAPA